MTAYDLTRHAIEVAQWLVVPALMYALRRAPVLLRLGGVVLLGWIGMSCLVLLYWNYAVGHAPSQELAEYFAARDGAEISFAYHYGWEFVIVYMALLEAARITFVWAKRRRSLAHD